MGDFGGQCHHGLITGQGFLRMQQWVTRGQSSAIVSNRDPTYPLTSCPAPDLASQLPLSGVIRRGGREGWGQRERCRLHPSQEGLYGRVAASFCFWVQVHPNTRHLLLAEEGRGGDREKGREREQREKKEEERHMEEKEVK